MDTHLDSHQSEDQFKIRILICPPRPDERVLAEAAFRVWQNAAEEAQVITVALGLSNLIAVPLADFAENIAFVTAGAKMDLPRI